MRGEPNGVNTSHTRTVGPDRRSIFSVVQSAEGALLVATFVDSAGTAAFASTSIVYLVHYLEFGSTSVGAALSLGACSGVIGSALIGRAVGRFGSKHLYMTANLVLALLFVGYGFISTFRQFAFIAATVGLVRGFTIALRSVITAQVYAQRRLIANSAKVRTVFNVGFGLGSVAGFVVLVTNSGPTAIKGLFALNGASFILVAILANRFPSPPLKATPRVDHHHGVRPRSGLALFSRTFVVASVGSGVLLYLGGAVLDIGVPLWILRNGTLPLWLIPVLLGLNCILIVGFQLPASRLADSVGGAARVGGAGSIILAFGCTLVAASSYFSVAVAVSLLIISTIFLTAAEALVSVSVWGIWYGLAPADRQAEVLGAFNAVGQVFQAGGPFVMALTVRWSLTGWLVLSVGFCVIGGLLVGAKLEGRKLHAR